MPDKMPGSNNSRRCNMNGCGCGPSGRTFLTKDEKIEMLEEYKESLEKEAKGVAERIKELKNN